MGTKSSYLEVKWPKHEADYPLPSSAKSKNVWNFTYTLPRSATLHFTMYTHTHLTMVCMVPVRYVKAQNRSDIRLYYCIVCFTYIHILPIWCIKWPPPNRFPLSKSFIHTYCLCHKQYNFLSMRMGHKSARNFFYSPFI
jgi:hypothetical protein